MLGEKWMYISELKINGFKKFNDFSIEFNPNINVLIGENEEGKSTILEAIDIVLNQRYFLNQSTIFEQHFNLENVEVYKRNPTIENLPYIEIEIFLHEDNENINEAFFNGYHSTKESLCTGIKFIYSFDESFRYILEDHMDHNEAQFIPTEFYNAKWYTFAGNAYMSKKSPIKNVLIDNSIRKNNLYNSYSKKIYHNNFKEIDKQTLSHDLRSNLKNFLNENNEKLKIKDYKLSIDENKTILDNLLDLQSEGISIQNKGKGTENIIKMEIALEVESNLIMLEEPENHLSYINTRKLLEDIQNKGNETQLIITTHNPLVVSRLNLQNTLWIKNCSYNSLKAVPKLTADFFKKSDNMQVLNFILAEKAIIVEGNSEYILIPGLIKNTLGKNLEHEKIELLSAGGITYKHYIELAKVIGNNLLVVTDNDAKSDNLSEIKETNQLFTKDAESIYITCSSDIKEFTFEVCLYNKNHGLLKNIYLYKPKTTCMYRNINYEKGLAYMLKNKTEAALKISEEHEYKDEILLPEYIKEGIEWLIQK